MRPGRRGWWQRDSGDADEADEADEAEEVPLDEGSEDFIEPPESTQIITELDVLYGDQRPFFGFERVKNGPVLKKEAQKHESVDLVFRRGNPRKLSACPSFRC